MDSSFISSDDTWTLWGFIVIWAAVSIYLEQKYKWASKVSGAIIALVGAMFLANLNILPLSSSVYDAVWAYIVPLAIPLLLFEADLRKIFKESGRILILFLIGAIGTAAGTLVSFYLLKDKIPELEKISAMISASYVGGGVNFAAMSSKYETSGEMVSSTVVADNFMMALFFFILFLIPGIRFFRSWLHQSKHNMEEKENLASEYWKRKDISLKDLALNLATAFALVVVSFKLAEFVGTLFPSNLSPFLAFVKGIIADPYLVLTTLTVLSVTLKPGYFKKIHGSQELGTFFIYLFFVVIGIPASLPIIFANAPLLLLFVFIIALMNLIFTLFFGRIFKFSLEEMLLASNANIGGPTTAAAMAIAKGWNKLVIPILLVGTLGYIIGNYIGTTIGLLLGAK